MDFSELVARAPWTLIERPAAQVFNDIIAAFSRLNRTKTIPLVRPPGSDRFQVSDHAHVWPEVFLQLTGERSFRFTGATRVLAPGQAAVVPRGCEHHERLLDQGRGHACLVLMCYPGRLSVHIAIRGRDGQQTGLHGDIYADTEGAGTDRLCDELALADDAVVQAALMTTLLAHVQRCIQGASLHAGGHPPLVDRCLRLIAVYLGHPDLGVAELAERLGCHPDHLGRVFRTATGETLVGHLARRRCDLAADLLADGRASVASVATACGFSDPAYFSRVFRRLRGTSPALTRAAACAAPVPPLPGPPPPRARTDSGSSAKGAAERRCIKESAHPGDGLKRAHFAQACEPELNTPSTA